MWDNVISCHSSSRQRPTLTFVASDFAEGNSDRPQTRAQTVTIRDVAVRAGVSKSLVSRVLRGESNVSAGRRALVEAAVHDLGYRGGQQNRRTHARGGTAGVILNDLRNPWFVDILEGLTTSLDAVDVAPVLADSRLDRRVGRDTVERLLAQGVDGLIVVGTTEIPSHVLAAASASVPIVLAGTLEPNLSNIDIVADDDVAGARLATDHLLSLGHTAIAHLQGPGIVGALRRQGYHEAMNSAGIADTVIEFAGMDEEGGFSAAGRVLDRTDHPTAIMCFNDVTCVGALSAASDRGISVPENLSVTGYDDTYLARIKHLSLTSVDNGNFAVGALAAKYLVQRIEGLDAPQRVHLHQPSLVKRRSTAVCQPDSNRIG